MTTYGNPNSYLTLTLFSPDLDRNTKSDNGVINTQVENWKDRLVDFSSGPEVFRSQDTLIGQGKSCFLLFPLDRNGDENHLEGLVKENRVMKIDNLTWKLSKVELMGPVENAMFFPKQNNVKDEQCYIEFIEVKQSGHEIYMENMKEICGPGMGRVWEQNLLTRFMALEQKQLYYGARGFNWNQVHLNGVQDVSLAEQAVLAYDVVLREIHPQKLSYGEYTKALREYADLNRLERFEKYNPTV